MRVSSICEWILSKQGPCALESPLGTALQMALIGPKYRELSRYHDYEEFFTRESVFFSTDGLAKTIQLLISHGADVNKFCNFFNDTIGPQSMLLLAIMYSNLNSADFALQLSKPGATRDKDAIKNLEILLDIALDRIDDDGGWKAFSNEELHLECPVFHFIESLEEHRYDLEDEEDILKLTAKARRVA